MLIKFPKIPILLVDDEIQAFKSYSFALETSSINNVIHCSDSRKVLSILSKQTVELVVLDLMMPYISGEELLQEIIREFPDVPVIMLTAIDDVNMAVDCMKFGAFDYMVKPVEKSRLVSGITRALEIRELKRENSLLKDHLFSDKLKHPEAFASIVTMNKEMFSIFKYIETIAMTSYPVLAVGETGTGKELLARAIHNLSNRNGAFVPINVAGLDDNMFSDSLFGHKKGAFTGADTTREGLIEYASGGTLFLDEIGDLGVTSQVKLLRLLQEKEYYPLGTDRPQKADVRIVTSTNRNLDNLMEKGAFRKDLYYRMNTHKITIPPLRKRLDDISLLLDKFISETAISLGKRCPAYPPQLVQLLSTYNFPGNVREFQGMVFDAVSVHDKGMLSMKIFEKSITAGRGENLKDKKNQYYDFKEIFSDKFPNIKEIETFLIKEAMKVSKNNQSLASKLLGISRPTLIRRLKQTKNR